MTQIVICPGIHSPQLTDSFVAKIGKELLNNCLIFPTSEYPAYSIYDIYQWLKIFQGKPSTSPPLIFITFSAGVVGGIGAALAWHQQGGQIKKFMALDGWGVPLIANFPIYRLSHDRFTHWSSAILGGGNQGFYCDPSVEHLTLWRSPDACWGWRTINSRKATPCSAAQYIQGLLT
ncbi:MAG: hypothetical protein Tsb0014_26910 [Pleurocapsa sp.]